MGRGKGGGGGGDSSFEDSLIVEVEGHRMADKVLGAGLEAELLVDKFHRVSVEVNAWRALRVSVAAQRVEGAERARERRPAPPPDQSLVRLTLVRDGVVVLPILKEFEELLRPPLLKDTHEARPEGLHLGRGHLGNSAVTVDERARDLAKLEVPEDVGVDQNLGELARGNNELGNQVDGPWR